MYFLSESVIYSAGIYMPCANMGDDFCVNMHEVSGGAARANSGRRGRKRPSAPQAAVICRPGLARPDAAPMRRAARTRAAVGVAPRSRPRPVARTRVSSSRFRRGGSRLLTRGWDWAS